MSDTVTSQTLFEDSQRVVMKFTNVSDATGESAVTKVDMSALNPAPDDLRISRVWATADGMSVNVLWDADTDVLALTVPAGFAGALDYRDFGGIRNNAGTGKTGDIKFTTFGHGSGDSYSIIMEMMKVGV